MTDLILDIAAVVDELTSPIRSEQRIQDRDHNGHILGRGNRAPRRVWTTILPSLLDQLARAVQPGESYDEAEHARAAPGSRPAARLDAIATMLRIDAATTVWANRLDLAWRGSTAATIRGLVGAVTLHPSDTQRELSAATRAWHGWAAVTAGWERPPDAPRGTCPACSALNTIRVRLAEKRAACIGCGAWWNEETIGVLAAHITMPAVTVDTAALRAQAVAQRRAEELRRVALATPTRPNLPYL